MAQTVPVFAEASDSTSSTTIRRQPSIGFSPAPFSPPPAPPPPGSPRVYCFNPQGAGQVATYFRDPILNPVTTGCGVTAALCKRPGPGASVFIFGGYTQQPPNAPSIYDSAYLLGLSDADPARLILYKGPVGVGLLDASLHTSTPGNLAVSTATFPSGQWVHVSLQVVVNVFQPQARPGRPAIPPMCDTVLNVAINDLTKNPVNAPIWQPVPGMPMVIDDGLGVTTGSLPLYFAFMPAPPTSPVFTPGRVGYGFTASGPGQVALVDGIVAVAQA